MPSWAVVRGAVACGFGRLRAGELDPVTGGDLGIVWTPRPLENVAARVPDHCTASRLAAFSAAVYIKEER